MRTGLVGVGVLAAASSAFAAGITVTTNNNPATLLNALLQPGNPINVTNINVSGKSFGNFMSTGVYSTVGNNNYKLTGAVNKGIVISTGNAADYGSGPNTAQSWSTNFANGEHGVPALGGPGVPATAAQEAILDPITGGNFQHFDVTQIDVTFQVPTNLTNPELFFNVVFGSEEFPDFVGTNFIDGFGLLLNGTNLAFVNGAAANINHPNFANVLETELDGVINFGSVFNPNPPIFTIAVPVTPGSTNTVTFIIGDASDGIYDSTAYINGLGVPEPSTLALIALGAIAGFARRR